MRKAVTRFLNPIRCAGLAILFATTACPAGEDLPNIVIIYADDLGYGDLSCYNPKAAYKTPRLDRMAKEGIRFTDAHSPSTICSPSRLLRPVGLQNRPAIHGV